MRESGGVGEGEAGVGQLFTPLAIKGKCSRARSSSRAGSLTWEHVNACSSQMRNVSNTQTRTESCGQRFSLHCANSDLVQQMECSLKVYFTCPSGKTSIINIRSL